MHEHPRRALPNLRSCLILTAFISTSGCDSLSAEIQRKALGADFRHTYVGTYIGTAAFDRKGSDGAHYDYTGLKTEYTIIALPAEHEMRIIGSDLPSECSLMLVAKSPTDVEVKPTTCQRENSTGCVIKSRYRSGPGTLSERSLIISANYREETRCKDMTHWFELDYALTLEKK